MNHLAKTSVEKLVCSCVYYGRFKALSNAKIRMRIMFKYHGYYSCTSVVTARIRDGSYPLLLRLLLRGLHLLEQE